jgi:opacity protein-like surface antigen
MENAMNNKFMCFAVTGLLSCATAQAASGLAGPYVGGQLTVAQPSMTIEDSDCWYNCSAYTQRKLGALVGIQGGYNWVSDGFLLGTELEYSAGSIEKTFEYGYYNDPRQAMKLTSTLKGLGSLRFKSGLVIGDTAFVVSVGPAFGKFEGEFRAQDNTVDRADDDVATQSGNMSGLAFGAGIEHAWTPNLLINFRYSRYSFTEKTSVVDEDPLSTDSKSIVKFVNEADTFALGASWSF